MFFERVKLGAVVVVKGHFCPALVGQCSEGAIVGAPCGCRLIINSVSIHWDEPLETWLRMGEFESVCLKMGNGCKTKLLPLLGDGWKEIYPPNYFALSESEFIKHQTERGYPPEKKDMEMYHRHLAQLEQAFMGTFVPRGQIDEDGIFSETR